MLQFHGAICEILHIPPVISSERLAILDECEESCGIAFPAAVREWFAIPDVELYFSRHSYGDELVSVNELGEGQRKQIAQGWLMVAIESQGVLFWFCQLDGTEDPSVWHDNYNHMPFAQILSLYVPKNGTGKQELAPLTFFYRGGQTEQLGEKQSDLGKKVVALAFKERLCSHLSPHPAASLFLMKTASQVSWRQSSLHFSGFIFDFLADSHYKRWTEELHIDATSPDFSDAMLKMLQSHFQQGPFIEQDKQKVHRFYNEGALLRVSQSGVTEQVEWTIRAVSQDALREVLSVLKPNRVWLEKWRVKGSWKGPDGYAGQRVLDEYRDSGELDD